MPAPDVGSNLDRDRAVALLFVAALLVPVTFVMSWNAVRYGLVSRSGDRLLVAPVVPTFRRARVPLEGVARCEVSDDDRWIRLSFEYEEGHTVHVAVMRLHAHRADASDLDLIHSRMLE